MASLAVPLAHRSDRANTVALPILAQGYEIHARVPDTEAGEQSISGALPMVGSFSQERVVQDRFRTRTQS